MDRGLTSARAACCERRSMAPSRAWVFVGSGIGAGRTDETAYRADSVPDAMRLLAWASSWTHATALLLLEGPIEAPGMLPANT